MWNWMGWGIILMGNTKLQILVSQLDTEKKCKFQTLRVHCHLKINMLILLFFYSVMLNSVGQSGPELYLVDPSGVTWVHYFYVACYYSKRFYYSNILYNYIFLNFLSFL